MILPSLLLVVSPSLSAAQTTWRLRPCFRPIWLHFETFESQTLVRGNEPICESGSTRSLIPTNPAETFLQDWGGTSNLQLAPFPTPDLRSTQSVRDEDSVENLWLDSAASPFERKAVEARTGAGWSRTSIVECCSRDRSHEHIKPKKLRVSFVRPWTRRKDVCGTWLMPTLFASPQSQHRQQPAFGFIHRKTKSCRSSRFQVDGACQLRNHWLLRNRFHATELAFKITFSDISPTSKQ